MRKDYFETHTKEDNITGINTIIEILENIKNKENIDKYSIKAEIKNYCMHDHTKGTFVRTSQIGRKIEIIISEGVLQNVEKTSIGLMIEDEE